MQFAVFLVVVFVEGVVAAIILVRLEHFPKTLEKRYSPDGIGVG